MRLKYYFRGLAVGILLTTIVLSVANADNRPLTDAQIRKRALELGMIEGDSVKLSSLHVGEGTDSSGGHSGGTAEVKTSEHSTVDSTKKSEVKESSGGSEGSVSENSVSVSSPTTTESSSGSSPLSSRPTASESSLSSSPLTSRPTATGSSAGSSPLASRPTASGSSPGSSASVSSVPESEPETAGQSVTFQIRSGASSYTVSKELAALGLVEDATAFDDFLCNNGYSRRLRAGIYEILPGTSEEDIAKLITR